MLTNLSESCTMAGFPLIGSPAGAIADRIIKDADSGGNKSSWKRIVEGIQDGYEKAILDGSKIYSSDDFSNSWSTVKATSLLSGYDTVTVELYLSTIEKMTQEGALPGKYLAPTPGAQETLAQVAKVAGQGYGDLKKLLGIAAVVAIGVLLVRGSREARAWHSA